MMGDSPIRQMQTQAKLDFIKKNMDQYTMLQKGQLKRKWKKGLADKLEKFADPQNDDKRIHKLNKTLQKQFIKSRIGHRINQQNNEL